MKSFYLVVLISIVLLTLVNKPDDNYWKTAEKDGALLYNIYFTDNGCYAVSNNDILFISNDNGSSWQAADPKEMSNINSKEFIWSARVCCSSLKTTDAGKSWISCNNNTQNRFCRVFLKDPNTGYQPAEEFLNTVCSKIFTSLLNNSADLLKKHPQQYTEYYVSQAEGWAPGWYLSDLMTFDTLKKLK